MIGQRKRLHFKSRRKQRVQVKLILALAGAGILICMAMFLKHKLMPEITLNVKAQSILQEEAVPVIEVSASCTGRKGKVLDKKSKYTVQSLLDDFKQGKGYTLKHKIDETKEGDYSVSIALDKKTKKNLQDKWRRKVKVKTVDGTFQVKNKYGTWEKEKFKKWDGSYVVSDFIESEGETYYFDAEGKMVTGEMRVGRTVYVFREDGVLESKEDRIDPAKPMIALTFDDGPGKYTDTLLTELEKYNAKATFFMQGKNAAIYQDEIKKMKELGCELGNHSQTHTSLVKLNDAGVRWEIDSTDAAIAAAAGEGASVLRPPYGDMNVHVRNIAGKPFVMWSLDTLDWKRKNAAEITEYVLNNVADGDIVLMHDIHDFSVEATIALIPQLIEKGYQLVTVSEMANARGNEMVNGEKYFSFKPN